MSETTSRVKISGFSQDRKDVRIIETDGQLVPYKVENIEIHPKMDGGDYVDAVYQDGKLVKLVYPPGLEPEGPSKTEIHKQFVEEAKTAKVLQWQIAHIDGSKVVLTKGDLDAQFKLIENAAKFHKSFHQGDLVQFVKADEKTIKTLWKVDENGVRPPKKNYNVGNIDVSDIVGAILSVGYHQLTTSGRELSPIGKTQLKASLLAESQYFATEVRKTLDQEVKN